MSETSKDRWRSGTTTVSEIIEKQSWRQRCMHYLHRLVRRRREASRDRVAESFALRYKALDCRRAALARDNAIMRDDKDGAAKHEAERARVHHEWEEMADSYERRWLAPNQGCTPNRIPK